MADIKLDRVVKHYGDNRVIHGVDLDIQNGEFIVFVGPSGCGKSTLLRMVAGLEDITEGKVYIGERLVNHLPPKDRNVAMVFQDYALYPHMNVRENLAFGLKMRKMESREIDRKIGRAAEMLQIEEFMDRRPKALSGGQRQRVAIGRAIVRDPDVFLFDEPLSNLDANLRSLMRIEIAKIHRKLNNTSIYVTHDQSEAMTLADRIVVIKGGHIMQTGTPDEVYNTPANRFVAEFIGSPRMNFLNLDVDTGTAPLHLTGDGVKISVQDALRNTLSEQTGVILGVRPEDIFLKGAQQVPENCSEPVMAEVEVVENLGSEKYVIVQVGDSRIIVKTRSTTTAKVGEEVALLLDMSKVHLFDRDSEERLQG